MEDSNHEDKDMTMHNLLLSIQREIVIMRKKCATEKEKREAKNRREMSTTISELAKILRKEVICKIETRFESMPFNQFALG